MSTNPTGRPAEALIANAISAPLIRHVYTADPSAHVFEGRIYLYPSHDIESGVPAGITKIRLGIAITRIEGACPFPGKNRWAEVPQLEF